MWLPFPPSRAALRSFWLLVSLATGATAAAAAAVIGVAGGAVLLVGGFTSLLVFTPALPNAHNIAWAYRGWHRAARLCATAVSRYVTAVCFLTFLLAAVGSRRTSGFVASSTASSMWVRRRRQPGEAYASQHHDRRVGSDEAGWTRPLRLWAQLTGNRWAFVLLPFIRLLRVLDSENDRRSTSPPTEIYTLY